MNVDKYLIKFFELNEFPIDDIINVYKYKINKIEG